MFSFFFTTKHDLVLKEKLKFVFLFYFNWLILTLKGYLVVAVTILADVVHVHLIFCD